MPNSSRSDDLVTPKQIEVLVVQSNPDETMLTVEAFHAAGLTTGLNYVTEGEDALSYVRGEGKYADVPPPDLIFLDLSQPRVSGLEVLKVIKSTPELMHIPIVVASGSDDPQLVRAVYALNGNCFIRKPGELREFVQLDIPLTQPTPTYRFQEWRITRAPFRSSRVVSRRKKTAEPT